MEAFFFSLLVLAMVLVLYYIFEETVFMEMLLVDIQKRSDICVVCHGFKASFHYSLWCTMVINNSNTVLISRMTVQTYERGHGMIIGGPLLHKTQRQ
jgi:hypothetical protein